MHFDFAAILVILTAVTGGIWAVDSLLFAPRRRAALAGGGVVNADEPVKEPLLVEYSRSFFPVILIVLIIRSFLAEPFRIPSSSMLPTLLVGDLILVNKFSYGIRLPVLNTKVLELGQPERGDVVVFRYPDDPSLDYIKRVVGVPGDRIEYKNKTLFVNGEKVETELGGPYEGTDDGVRYQQLQGVEKLPGREHQILVTPGAYHPLSTNRWVVGEGEYFVLGDNRDNSRDSRYWGFVPEENLVGKAFLIWMHLSPSGWGRIGTVID
ncbi:MAG: signal peptidase I [Xanthomonadales bacterium]|nr:signal peptidase I [Xanthomonadales bacterium]